MHCGSSLFEPMVPTKRKNFKDWSCNVARPLEKALRQGDRYKANEILNNERNRPRTNYYKTGDKIARSSAKDAVYRDSIANYVRRKMKNFFDLTIIDEIHNTKALKSSVGIASGRLISASKKVIGATGTLLGGLATDIFAIYFRLFPSMMIKAGFNFNSERKFGTMYGNMEYTTMVDGGSEGYKKYSGGRDEEKTKEKVVPGISPFVFAKFLIHNTIFVRLLDVWENPVPLIEVPTILCEMSEEQRIFYEEFENSCQTAISKEKGTTRAMLTMGMIRGGVDYPDNMVKFPDLSLTFKGEFGYQDKITLFESSKYHLDAAHITPKEKNFKKLL